MDSSRFDRLARALGRRATRRSALAATIGAVTGGVVLAGDQAGAAVCTAEGASCASVACCAGLACDSETQTCLGGPGATCRISAHCASGLKCKRGVCEGALVCRTLRESCAPHTVECCSNLSCAPGKHVCVGMPGFAGCESDDDCGDGLVCEDDVCQVLPTPGTGPVGFGDVVCDVIIEPGTDNFPEEEFPAGAVICLASGDHYLVERILSTNFGGGGSIYGAADGSTTVYAARDRNAITMPGPGVLANLTVISTSAEFTGYGVSIAPEFVGDETVLVSNVNVDTTASPNAKAVLLVTTEATVEHSTFASASTVLYVEMSTVSLVNTTLTGGKRGLQIEDGTVLTMDADSRIVNNNRGGDHGAAVLININEFWGGASFTNNGGTISGNVSTADDCDNNVSVVVEDEDEYVCCTNAGNGKTGTCSFMTVP